MTTMVLALARKIQKMTKNQKRVDNSVVSQFEIFLLERRSYLFSKYLHIKAPESSIPK